MVSPTTTRIHPPPLVCRAKRSARSKIWGRVLVTRKQWVPGECRYWIDIALPDLGIQLFDWFVDLGARKIIEGSHDLNNLAWYPDSYELTAPSKTVHPGNGRKYKAPFVGVAPHRTKNFKLAVLRAADLCPLIINSRKLAAYNARMAEQQQDQREQNEWCAGSTDPANRYVAKHGKWDAVKAAEGAMMSAALTCDVVQDEEDNEWAYLELEKAKQAYRDALCAVVEVDKDASGRFFNALRDEELQHGQ